MNPHALARTETQARERARTVLNRKGYEVTSITNFDTLTNREGGHYGFILLSLWPLLANRLIDTENKISRQLMSTNCVTLKTNTEAAIFLPVQMLPLYQIFH